MEGSRQAGSVVERRDSTTVPVGMGMSVAQVVANRKTASSVVRPRDSTTVGVREKYASKVVEDRRTAGSVVQSRDSTPVGVSRSLVEAN